MIFKIKDIKVKVYEIAIKVITLLLFLKILLVSFTTLANSDDNFNVWLSSYKKLALKRGISQETIDIAFKNVKFLEKVIKYDRKQPEFYEDTITYVNKRANNLRVEKAKKLLKKNIILFNEIENKFSVKKKFC